MASKASNDDRLVRLRKLMKDYDIDIYIIPTEDSHASEWIAECDARRHYISGFLGSAGCAVVTADTAVLATDGRYFNQAEKQLSESWQILKQGLKEVPTWQEWIVEHIHHDTMVGVDPCVISAQNAETLVEKIKRAGGSLRAVPENLVDLIWGDERPARSVAPVRILAQQFTGKSVRKKLEEVREALAKKKATGVVVSMLDETAWLLNLRGSDIPYNPVFLSYAVVTLSKAVLFMDPDKMSPDIQSHLASNGVSTRPYSAFFSEVAAIFETIDDMQTTGQSRPTGRICISLEGSWALQESLGGSKRVEVVRSMICHAKAIKNGTEVDGMRACHTRDGAAQIEFFAWLEHELVVKAAKVSEIAAADVLERFRSKHENFVGLSFPCISASGANAAIIHYKPDVSTCSAIDPSKIYLCDSGAQYFDGTTDTTRTLHFGRPSPLERKAYTLVLKGLIALSNTVFPTKTSGYALDSLARQFLWEEGMDYRHGTGHGVGSFLNVHEGPIGISPRTQYAEVELAPGHVLSNEPGYYENGSFGVRIENVIIVKELLHKHTYSGTNFLAFESVTMVPYCRALIDETLLTKREREWIDHYHAEVYIKTEKFFREDALTMKWLQKETRPLSSS